MMVLANAIYFKGKWKSFAFECPITGIWKKQFNKRRTREGDFHTLNGGVVKCQMMHDDSRYPYAQLQELDAEAIKLPFQM